MTNTNQVAPKVQVKIDTLRANIAELQVALAAALATEQLVDGAVYSIHIGKGETARVVEATLIGQRIKDNGAAEFRFSHGEGFDARFYDIAYNRVVTDNEGVSSATITRNIARIETNIENLISGKTAVKGVLDLVNGGTYKVKVGRGDTADEVAAVLMDQRYDETGNQEFIFFTGAGFDAQVIKCRAGRVVVEEDAEQQEGFESEAPAIDAGVGTVKVLQEPTDGFAA